MTGRTHREFSILFTCVAIMLVSHFYISDVNFYATYFIMNSLGIQGGLFPDVDHIWKNVKDKTVLNKIINTLIHITGGTHRSIHTHSVEIWFISGMFALWANHKFHAEGLISEVNYQMYLIMLLGFYSGWGSHLFSDALTIGGIFIFGKKIKFVPRQVSIGRGKKKKTLVFKTGDIWEAFVYKQIVKINTVVTIITLLFPVWSSEKAFEIYTQFYNWAYKIVMVLVNG